MIGERFAGTATRVVADRWTVEAVFFSRFSAPGWTISPLVSRHVALERRRGGTPRRRPRGFFHFTSCRPSTTRFPTPATSAFESPPFCSHSPSAALYFLHPSPPLTPSSSLTRYACPSFYFCNRVSLWFVRRPLSLSRARTDQPAPVFILKPSVRYFRPDRFSLPCVYSRISSGWYLPAFPFLFSFPCSFCASFMEDGSRRLELTGSFNSEIEKTKTSVRWRKMKSCASFRFCMGFDDFFLF